MSDEHLTSNGYEEMQENIQTEREIRDAEITALKEKGISGVIADAKFTTNPDGVNVSGYCTVDTKGRGFAGYPIRTSMVMKVYEEDSVWYVKTYYSLYQVTWAEGVVIPKEFLNAK